MFEKSPEFSLCQRTVFWGHWTWSSIYSGKTVQFSYILVNLFCFQRLFVCTLNICEHIGFIWPAWNSWIMLQPVSLSNNFRARRKCPKFSLWWMLNPQLFSNSESLSVSRKLLGWFLVLNFFQIYTREVTFENVQSAYCLSLIFLLKFKSLQNVL